MKKTAALFIALFIFTSSVIQVVNAQTEESKNYLRLYNQFIRNLDKQRLEQEAGTTNEEQAAMPGTPSVEMRDKPDVPKTGEFSITGKIYRNDQGAYFIRPEGKEKGSKELDPRVFGRKLSNAIVGAVVFGRVQLIGNTAFYNGKEVGISVKRIVVLSGVAPEYSGVVPTKPMPPLAMFSGKIYLENGRAYLYDGEVSRILLNRDNWELAFQNAYKGEVKIKGYLTGNGGIRYVEISK